MAAPPYSAIAGEDVNLRVPGPPAPDRGARRPAAGDATLTDNPTHDDGSDPDGSPSPSASPAEPVEGPSDGELLRRIRMGDERALEVIFRAHYDTMCAVVRRIVFAPDVAEELVQDVFFKLWSKREQLAEIDALRTYLYRAARNTALNHLRRQKLELAHEEREAAKGEPSTSEATGDSASAVELTEAVQEAIQRLPPRCREIFLMSRDGGLTYGQIASELGISIKTVETQMGRALKSLRLSLARYRVAG